VADPLPKAAGAQAGRCVAVIRAAVRGEGTTLIRHTITAIRTRGVHREFIIESAVYGSAGSDAQAFVSRCLAERWGDGADLKWVRPVPSGVVLAGR
jgi:hypothetical protein